jgi:hypothetical protein
MSEQSRPSSPSSDDSENLVLRVQRLRQQAEDFQRTIEQEIRTTIALIDELRVSQAKRRHHGRRVDEGDFR